MNKFKLKLLNLNLRILRIRSRYSSLSFLLVLLSFQSINYALSQNSNGQTNNLNTNPLNNGLTYQRSVNPYLRETVVNPYAAAVQAGFANSPYAGQIGRYPYANQAGFGYYNANPLAPGFPVYGTPVQSGNGYFNFNIAGAPLNGYWRAPSGYYYPWGLGTVINNIQAPIMQVQQGSSQPALPPVNDILQDMSSFIDKTNKDGKFKTDDYQHLARRVKDLQVKLASIQSRNGGTLEQFEEDNLREDCARLSGDIARRTLP